MILCCRYILLRTTNMFPIKVNFKSWNYLFREKVRWYDLPIVAQVLVQVFIKFRWLCRLIEGLHNNIYLNKCVVDLWIILSDINIKIIPKHAPHAVQDKTLHRLRRSVACAWGTAGCSSTSPPVTRTAPYWYNRVIILYKYILFVLGKVFYFKIFITPLVLISSIFINYTIIT